MTEKIKLPKLNVSDIEKIIVDLGKQGVSSDKIGLILRDQHGIPKVKTLGMKIGKILVKHNMEKSPEKVNTQKKIENLRKHFAANKHDYTAQRKTIMYAARLKKMERLSAK
ncbi:hypothetical protein EXS72_02685 [Candidatus Pacearchaeota archaeon]|nr:hypothetical protein [Candidatus Pacearchaeota archaeon]